MNLIKMIGIDERELRNLIFHGKKGGWAIGNESPLNLGKGWGYEYVFKKSEISFALDEMLTFKGKCIWEMHSHGIMNDEFLPPNLDGQDSYRLFERIINYLKQISLKSDERYIFGPMEEPVKIPGFPDLEYSARMFQDGLEQFCGKSQILTTQGAPRHIYNIVFSGGLLILNKE